MTTMMMMTMTMIMMMVMLMKALWQRLPFSLMLLTIALAYVLLPFCDKSVSFLVEALLSLDKES